MSAIVVFWTGTGNTEEIANKISSDLGVNALNVSDTTPADTLAFDTIILGCPAMGAEELEDGEFRPFYEEVLAGAENKKLALFGSYGWGGGEWMRTWEEEVKSKGVNLVTDGLISNGGASDLDDGEYNTFINALKANI